MHFVRSSTGFLIGELAGVLAAGVLASGCHSAMAANPPAEHATTAAFIPPRADSVIRDSVRHVLDRALRDSAFPGAIAVVGTHDRVIAQYAVGHLDWAASPVPDEHSL